MDYDFLLQKLYEIKGRLDYDPDAVQTIQTCIKIIESKPQRIACKVDYDERFKLNIPQDHFENYMRSQLVNGITEHIKQNMEPKTQRNIWGDYMYIDLWVGGLSNVEPKVYPSQNDKPWITLEETGNIGGWRDDRNI